MNIAPRKKEQVKKKKPTKNKNTNQKNKQTKIKQIIVHMSVGRSIVSEQIWLRGISYSDKASLWLVSLEKQSDV